MSDDAGRADAAAELDEIERDHDDFPQEAADRLRRLDAAGLAAGRLGAFALLPNPVLGAKLGARREAAQRVGALAAAFDAGLQRLIAQDAAELFAAEHA